MDNPLPKPLPTEVTQLLNNLHQAKPEVGGKYYGYKAYFKEKSKVWRIVTFTEEPSSQKILFKTYHLTLGKGVLIPQKSLFTSYTIGALLDTHPKESPKTGLICELLYKALAEPDETKVRKSWLIKASIYLQAVILKDAGQTSASAEALYLFNEVFLLCKVVFPKDKLTQELLILIRELYESYHPGSVKTKALAYHRHNLWVSKHSGGIYNNKVIDYTFSSQGGPETITLYRCIARLSPNGFIMNFMHNKKEFSFKALSKRIQANLDNTRQRLATDLDEKKKILLHERMYLAVSAAKALAYKDRGATKATRNAINILERCKTLLEQEKLETNISFHAAEKAVSIEKLIKEFQEFMPETDALVEKSMIYN